MDLLMDWYYPLPSICELATKIHISALMFGWMPKAQVEPKNSMILKATYSQSSLLVHPQRCSPPPWPHTGKLTGQLPLLSNPPHPEEIDQFLPRRKF